MRRLVIGLVTLAALTSSPAASAWTWPLGGDVLRAYSLGSDAYSAGQHRGVDVAGSAGELVRAPVSGTVTFAGVVPSSGRTVTVQAGELRRLPDPPRRGHGRERGGDRRGRVPRHRGHQRRG